jgi:hypothetical protein
MPHVPSRPVQNEAAIVLESLNNEQDINKVSITRKERVSFKGEQKSVKWLSSQCVLNVRIMFVELSPLWGVLPARFCSRRDMG